MSALPASSDVFFIMILILPGYFSLQIFRWLAYFRRKLSDTEILYSSLTFSIFIYIILGFFFQVSEFEAIKTKILEPQKSLLLLITTISFGFIPGLIIRIIRKYQRYIPGDSWSAIMKNAAGVKTGSWLTVYTNDFKEYNGLLHYYAAEKEKRELSIRKPIMIIRDKDYNVNYKLELGKELYFLEKDIKRIAFSEEV